MICCHFLSYLATKLGNFIAFYCILLYIFFCILFIYLEDHRVPGVRLDLPAVCCGPHQCRDGAQEFLGEKLVFKKRSIGMFFTFFHHPL